MKQEQKSQGCFAGLAKAIKNGQMGLKSPAMAREQKYLRCALNDDNFAVDMQVQNLARRFPEKSKAQVIEAFKEANGDAGLAAKSLSSEGQMTYIKKPDENLTYGELISESFCNKSVCSSLMFESSVNLDMIRV